VASDSARASRARKSRVGRYGLAEKPAGLAAFVLPLAQAARLYQNTEGLGGAQLQYAGVAAVGLGEEHS
jgi:hypothetical protein